MIQYFLPVLMAMIQLVTLTVIGFILRKKKAFPRAFFAQTSTFLINIVLPVYYFVRVSRSNFADLIAGAVFPFAAAIILLISIVIAVFYLSLFRFRGEYKRLGAALSVFGNVGFMPLFLAELFPSVIPELDQMFGTTTPSLYIGLYLFVASPALWSLGNYLLIGSVGKVRLRSLISPPIYGLTAGMLIPLLHLQGFLFNPDLPVLQIMNALDRLASSFFPLTLICLGANIAGISFNNQVERPMMIKMTLHVSVFRFLILPGMFFILYFTILRPFHIQPIYAWVFFLQMTVPTATGFSTLAAKHGVHEEIVSFTILFNYLLYIFILPGFLLLFLALPGILN